VQAEDAKRLEGRVFGFGHNGRSPP